MEELENEQGASKPDYEKWFEDDLENEDSELSKSYKSEDYISGPIRVKNGTVPINILKFYHSYAYDCQRYFNLCVAEPNTVIFASGNLIHFLNTSNGNVWFRRCSTGGGIGHITKNPSINHIAVGENGIDPPIIIYEWPSMKIITILRQGTTRSYSHLAYSPDGRLLVSQGGDPDYMITVWNWRKSKILLRCKSHGQDIYNVTFSPTVPGHLTTSGAGHIKFWKMARTFTGLKLKGQLGRFGKTEISDIIGVYAMPDEKVVSGCEWGNILLWDEDLIKLEACKKHRKPCHGKFITQFEFMNGELVSVGMDGWIRIWYYETIDQADPPDDNRFLENEPIYEFEIKEEGSEDGSMLMSIKKQDPDDPEQNLWYAQDANGGIWLLELGTFEQPKESPRKLLTCHAGPITWMDVSTWGPFVGTCGTDGHLHIYNYLTKRLILIEKFRDKCTRIVWFPCSIEATGSTLCCAFQSGILRVIALAISEANGSRNNRGDYLRLIQAIKPHKLAITAMSINSSKSLLVTGSEDSTIFVFCIKITDTYPSLVPIGYVKLFSGVSCMTWKPEQQTTIFIGCLRGECAEVELPNEPQDYTKITYELVECQPKYFKFKSVKSEIRRELARLEMEKMKEAKRGLRREKMEKLKEDNPGIVIDEEEFLMDADEDPPLPEIYIPEVPNRVLIANYTAKGIIWLSMGGYDAGYIYEYQIPADGSNLQLEPIKTTMVSDADDREISSCLFYKNNKYLFLGMDQGEIRVCRVNPKDQTDFSNYLRLPMHDNKNGFIPVILLSYDGNFLLSCGHDGNLFSYEIDDDTPPLRVETEKAEVPRPLPSSNVEDIEEPDHLILEEVLVKMENDRIAAVAKQKKDTTLKLLENLTEEYSNIIERNSKLFKSQQIPHAELELDPRITADLNNQLEKEMDLVHQKLAFEVEKSRLGLQKLVDHFIEPITCLPFAVCRISKPDTMVHSLRERKLGDDFSSTYDYVVKRIEEINRVSSNKDVGQCEKENAEEISDSTVMERAEEEAEKKKVQGIESFLKGLSQNTVEYRLGVQINQMLRKYRARKEKVEKRAKEWKIMYASKPDADANHPDDIDAINEAKNTIGDYKLKTSPEFNQQSKENRDTTLTKYKQILDCRRKTHNLRENFNSRLRNVRDNKLSLQNELSISIEKLKKIHAEIPEKYIKPLPVIPEIDYNIEFPEKNLELEKYTSMAERVKATKRKKMSISEEMILHPMDEEYEVLLLDEKLIEAELQASVKNLEATKSDKLFKARISVSPEILKSLNANDRMETPWEREMKRSRMMKKIYEQDCILMEIEKSYENLDQELDELEKERLDVVAESVYSDLFLLTLHQELIILKDFESMENVLTSKVKEKISECEIAKQKIRTMTSKIDQRNKEIGRINEKIKDLQTQFNSMISDNKFADFLRRIYKKKFKLPKNEDDESSSSSSSDSSSEDDAASIASDDLGPLHLNENICPAGCDHELYDLAFSMREERYECEHQIKEAQRIIELLRKDIDEDSKKLKLIETELKINEKDLEDYMREKQRKLNDVEMTVILKFHQLQHFVDENNVAKIRDCVVFDKTKLSQLYTRVGELEQDTFAQKEKHQKNRTHLHRMKIDCKHMEGVIKNLKDKIKDEMMKKFGREVSLDSLYEAVLRRMIYDVKADVKEMMKEFDEQIKCVKNKYIEKIELLESLIQENTEKLSFLTILEEEQLKLKKILRHTPESEDKILKIEADYQEDLERLQNMLKNQKHQKELFQNDIRNLRLKSKPLPPICAAKKKKLLQNIEKSDIQSDSLSLDILDLKPEKGLTAEEANFDSEDSEKIAVKKDNDSKITFNEMMKDVEDSRTATMVHRLLSRVMEGSTEENDGISREILKQIIENIPTGGGIEELRDGIKHSVDRIIASLPEADDETMEAMREVVEESLHDIVSRFEDEFRETNESSTDIGWNMKQKIEDLLDSMGINWDVKIEKTVIRLLKNESIETAMEYLSRNVQTISDTETLAALREHAFRTLAEIKEEMENEEIASQEEKPSIVDGEEMTDENEM